eukprot:TRINITY_DN488_c0_g1_i2.p1 TRINITY_DN488_c0_g1~~TRINITY_DN488_c0_g1_i2.p1  ORF type:complete len:231 (+),score=39.15 TRINITY_DN488_c0_g1_i2:72-764(+)
MIQAWFTGGPSSQSEEQVSILAEWKNYAASQEGGGSLGSSGDIEAGDAFAPIRQMGKTANDTLLGTFSTVSKNVQALPGSVQQGMSAMPSHRTIMYFSAALGTGVFFLFIAFTLFLPAIVLMPQKFAITFTLGCMFIMGAFFVLKGPAAQLKHMLSMERLPFTGAFVGSMLGTLYASLVLHSYILSVLFSGVQVMALAYYALSYFPGGSAGLKFLSSMVMSTVLKCFGAR